MAEQGSASGIKNLFTKHGEKIGLAIAVAALLAYLVLGLPSSAEPAVNQAEDAIQRAKKEKRSSHANDPEMKAPESKPWFSRAKDPWDSVIAAKSGGDWAATATPELKPHEMAKIEPKIKGVKIPSVTYGSTNVQIDSITLTWAVKGFTKQEMAKDKDNDYLPLDHFNVEREANGSGKWEVIGPNLPATATSFQDTKIDAKTKYNYRVVSYSEVDKSGIGRTPADGKHLVVTSGLVQSKGIWNLLFTNPSKPAGAERGMVYVTIEKYEKALGSKVEKRHIHYAGDQIGWWPDSDGGDPVSKHRISLSGGRTAEVDLDTKATLISVEAKKVTLDIKKCKPIYASDGGKKGCETVIEKRVFDTHEIVYKDDEGEKRAYFPNPRDLPLGQDQLCEEHGGKKMVTQSDLAPSKGPSVTPKTPDAPKEDPKVAIAKKKEEEAEKLFSEATKSEAAKNKASAISAYERLLTTYADTEFVSKQKKSVIEERLGALKSTKSSK